MKRILPGTLLALVMALAVNGQADADTGGVADKKNDVFVYDWVTDEADYGWWDPDISRLKVTHMDSRVKVTVGFHRLGKYPWDYLNVFIDSKGGNAADYRFQIGEHGNGVYPGEYGFTRVCSIKKDVNFKRDTVTLSAPRSCFNVTKPIRGKADYWASWGPDCCEDWASDWTAWTPPVRRG